MGKGNSVEMATSNDDLNEPIIFVVPDAWAYRVYDNRQQIEDRTNPDVKKYLINSLGIEKLTKVILIIPKKKHQFSESLNQINKLNNIEVKSGEKPLMILEFDTKKQKKELDFQNDLPLKIRY